MSNRVEKYKIIILDVGKTMFDKTLSDTVSDVLLADIIKLRQLGIKVGVCTMRTIQHCKTIIPVKLDFYISLNGSYIVCNDDIVIHDDPMQFIYNSLNFLTYGKDKTFFSSEHAKKKAIENGFLFDDLGIATPTYNTVIFDVKAVDLCKYSNWHYEYWANTKTLALQNKTSSRVQGISKVLNYYKHLEPILYFGDGPNDLEVFKHYKDCVCMGNCYPALEKYAILKTDTCANNGVSIALRKLNVL